MAGEVPERLPFLHRAELGARLTHLAWGDGGRPCGDQVATKSASGGEVEQGELVGAPPALPVVRIRGHTLVACEF